MKEKILLDTDIGTDIDDAVALAYLLMKPECDLLGITTVTGEAVKRARIASAICNVAGRKIPIYPGAENPLIIEQNQKVAQQAVFLDRWEHERNFPKYDAIEFMRDTIRKNPGEVTLLTVAPLTNIGLLFATDPEIPSLLKGLVMMAGYFERKDSTAYPREWNAFGDYHASKIVYNAKVKTHRSVGLDVTREVIMDSKEVKEKFKHPLLKPVLDFATVWFEKFYDSITFHDPLAATTIFNNDICTFTKGDINLDIDDNEHPGITRWNPNDEGKHEVALSVNKDKFFEEYFSVFK